MPILQATPIPISPINAIVTCIMQPKIQILKGHKQEDFSNFQVRATP